MSGTPVNTEYRMGSYEGNFKIISKSGETTTDRMVLNSAGDLTFNSAVTIRDLIVTGSQTEVSTVTATAYTVEKLDVVNTTINSPAIMVQQKKSSYDILVASNLNSKVFNIANNGDVNISGIYKKDNRDVIDDTSNYVLSTSNILVTTTHLNDINSSNYVASTSNILVDAIKNNKSSQWTTSNNNIYYNTSNVGIGTNNPTTKLHIRNDTTNTTALTIQNNNVPIVITSTPSATTTSTTGIYTYQIFTYTTETAGTGTRQTQYTLNVASGGITCDILMVGGGGAGGGGHINGGGGGGGALLYGSNIYIPQGSYNIYVGDGAIQGESTGKSTTGFGATILGGGSGRFYGIATPNYDIAAAYSGGSGGGGISHSIYASLRQGGGVNSSSIGILNGARLYDGNAGGAGVNTSGGAGIQSGGGGGAGAVGGQGNNIEGSKTGNGGAGVLVNILGADYYWGGGGGGGSFTEQPTDGGLGGGGAGEKGTPATINSLTYGSVGGSSYTTPVKMNAGNGTGGGGGGTGFRTINLPVTKNRCITSIVLSPWWGYVWYTSAPNIQITGGSGTGATATTTLLFGIVDSITIYNVGNGYTSAPTITITGGGGTGATAYAEISNGSITYITMIMTGSGYTSIPTIAITGGGGNGATATAIINTTKGKISSITMTNTGSNYTVAPITIMLTGGGQPNSRASAGTITIVSGSITNMTDILLEQNSNRYTPDNLPSVTITGGRFYNDSTTYINATASVSISTTAGSTYGMITTINITNGGSGYFNSTSQLKIAITGGGQTEISRFIDPVFSDAFITSVPIIQGGSGYTSAPTVEFIGGGGTGATATATISNGSVSSITMTNSGNGDYTNAPMVVFTGGGGSGATATTGKGGSGIIIIRYMSPLMDEQNSCLIEFVRGIQSDSNIDYSVGNYYGDFKIISSKNGTPNERMVLTSNGDFNINGFNILTKINDTSNYVTTTSNLLVNNAKLNDSNTSNYVRDTSNILVNLINSGSSSSSGSSGTSSQWTTSNNNIYYNTSNVGIGTYNPINKLHLYGETTNTTALTIQNNYKNEGIFSSPPATKTGIFGIYKYMSFSYRGDTSGNNSRQTKYTLTILRDIVCDILIVGGGGAGGHINGGGGGAGGVVYAINKTLTMGTYTIYVGRGGTVHNTIGDPKNTGAESSLKNSNGTSYISFVLGAESQELKGRGGGAGSGEQYLMFTNTNNNNNYEFRNINGGSGGGVYEYAFSGLQGGLSTQPNTYWNGSSYIAGGKYGRSTSTTDGNYYQSTGGGGAGSESADFRNGTNGVEINITGIPQFYAAGGGSGITNYDSNIKIVTGISVLNSSTINNIAIGGSSIGGDGSIYSYTTNMYLRYSATNGKDDTGSGGGGTSGPELNNLLFPGNGGSGIVIIKYIYKVSSIELLGGTSGDINVDYSIGNYDSDLKIISSEPETSKEIVNINSSGVVNVNGFVKSSVVAFHAVSSQLGNSVYTVPQNTILTGNYLQGWDIILINNTAWDPTTGIFTVPIKGIYMVLCTCIAMLTQQGFTIKLNVDNTNAILSGKIYGHALYTGTSTAGNSISAQAIINASIGDRISVWSNNVGIVTNMSTLQACSSISIYLIMPT